MSAYTLYRFFDDADQLLYVGITLNPPARFAQHRGSKGWWDTVVRIDLERYPNKVAVLAAEREAIITEVPAFNVVHSTGSVGRCSVCGVHMDNAQVDCVDCTALLSAYWDEGAETERQTTEYFSTHDRRSV
jgi:hypothetical protein